MDDKEKVILEDETVFILQPGLTIYVKTADICSMLGVSNQWVGQLTGQGTLNKMQTSHGKLFNLTDSIRSYMDSQNDKIKKTAEEKKLDKAKQTADVKLKVAKATVAELQAQELKGKMHRSEDVQVFTQELIDTIKNALLFSAWKAGRGGLSLRHCGGMLGADQRSDPGCAERAIRIRLRSRKIRSAGQGTAEPG